MSTTNATRRRALVTSLLALSVICMLLTEYRRSTIERIQGFRIAILPWEPFEPAMLEQTQAALSKTFHADVVMLPARPLPKEAYYAKRNRYRADWLLRAIGKEPHHPVTNILGVTSVDISTPRLFSDWGVMGLATKRLAVTSSFRLKLDSPSEQLLHARIRKVAIHEMGHTIGLKHCSDTKCIMHAAEGTVRQIDAETEAFCPVCAGLVAESMGAGGG